MHLKILQWNVWYKEKVENVLNEIKKLDLDVICLQELTHGYVKEHNKSSWDYIGEDLGFTFSFQEIPIVKGKDNWLQANAIFSKYPIKRQTTTWLHRPISEKDPADQYRGYLEVELDVKGKPVTVGTTHMSFGIDPQDDKELEQLLSILETKRQRYILTGDINAIPNSPRVKEITKCLKHVGPSYDQNTWTTKEFDLPEFKAFTLDWRYDYIFASHDIEVVDSKIVKTDVSDHLPVLAEVRLP